ncbi:hypothetical protein SM11_pC0089 (plasmid) [Sinorhizobium meliloti SM11]|uniref:AAA+ ATPase domain-containing protein n=3 Tax=Rhizobium meliloti TaxID=382 RepID=F7XB59_SINMM|nr:hypothetical protein [Sinorhizobium meliloti]AEH81162.1 hypothetical protein SM11_pC0089 [Sinorhizobium meliloti SM11]MDE4563273.1 hypothetical protein [Sinorhizobium meliloti SM11]
MLAMLAGNEARGAPGGTINRIQFQAADSGYALDDLVLHCSSSDGPLVLEIQSKRTITFSGKDPVFLAVCQQIAETAGNPDIAEDRHLLAVATQRTSAKISGPYQDVLEWARAVANSADFFARLSATGIASEAMRDFVTTFRANVVANGIADDDQTIWKLLRRFRILEFDFESGAPQARDHALLVARHVLSAQDQHRTEALWGNLIEIAISQGKAGGSLDKAQLQAMLTRLHYSLSGDRNLAPARAKLAEASTHALADIGRDVGGVHLPRQVVVDAIDEAMDGHRLIHLRGNAGVGKSSVFRTIAERVISVSSAFVLDPVRIPAGGWSELALRLGISVTAREFLTDLASFGATVVFIDSLDMFDDPARRSTVNDLLREIAQIPGVAVLTTARLDYGRDGDDWLANDALASLGTPKIIEVGDLSDDEVQALQEQAPQLKALLKSHHPAASISRNLYRLSRLLKVGDPSSIRTEADLALDWWRTADGAPRREISSAQRLLSDLVDVALGGGDELHLREDTAAREAMLRSLTLRQTRRDHLAFYHDVLRDWAVGIRIDEEPELLDTVVKSSPIPASLARGVEMAGRIALERGDPAQWQALLDRLTGQGIHSSWRRHALLAIVRSETVEPLLAKNAQLLLRQGGMLLGQLCTAVVAVDTVQLAKLTNASDTRAGDPSSLRAAITPAGGHVLRWCAAHANIVPLQALERVIRLGMAQLPLYLWGMSSPKAIAEMFFDWLLRLDDPEVGKIIHVDRDVATPDQSERRRIVEQLRSLCFLMASHAPASAAAYLSSIDATRDRGKMKDIRLHSKVLTAAAPQALADLIAKSLIIPLESRRHSARDKAFEFYDSDYLPPSPAQPPFLDLLNASPPIGLNLIRSLVAHAVEYRQPDNGDGFTIEFAEGERFFPYADTYFWSRGLANDFCVASALMALEVWGHKRLDDGEDVQAVLADVLGPDGTSTAFLLIAVDLILSHLPKTMSQAVPFLSSPELLAKDRGRIARDGMGSATIGDEPDGPVRLEDLRKRPSRGVCLEQILPFFLGHTAEADTLRAAIAAAKLRLGDYDSHANFGDPAFMAAHADNLLDRSNYIESEGGLQFCFPEKEAAHLERLQQRSAAHTAEANIGARVSLAVDDLKWASAEFAREAAEFAGRKLPGLNEADVLNSGATSLVSIAVLVSRDGDDALVDEYEDWVRAVAAEILGGPTDRIGAMRDTLSYNRPALAIAAILNLWLRKGLVADRNLLLELAGRDDRGGAPAFAAGLTKIVEKDARLVKAALRIAFRFSRYTHNKWEQSPAEAESARQVRDERLRRAVAAEIVWLEGGAEPEWPAFVPERPSVRRPFRIGRRVPDVEKPDVKIEEMEEAEDFPEFSDSQMAAAWLSAVRAHPHSDIESWLPAVVENYAQWTANANGLGLDADADLDQPPSEWNQQYYTLVARLIMEGSISTFEGAMSRLMGLPDTSFARTADIVLFASDVWYFNSSDHSAERPIVLRERIGQRLADCEFWQRERRRGDLSISFESGPLLANFFMNSYNPMARTTSYLVPSIFDRIDPLLDVLSRYVGGGPTAILAHFTMNTMSVRPRARHLEFVLAATEVWLERCPGDAAVWLELGLGRRIVHWLDVAAEEDGSILTPTHQHRARMDRIIGKLIELGVAEAHDFEQRIALSK